MTSLSDVEDILRQVFGSLYGERAEFFKNMFNEVVIALFREKNIPTYMIDNAFMTDSISAQGKSPSTKDVFDKLVVPLYYILETYNSAYYMFLYIFSKGIGNDDPKYGLLLEEIFVYVRGRLDGAGDLFSRFLPSPVSEKIVENAWFYATDSLNKVGRDELLKLIPQETSSGYKKFLEKFNEIYVFDKDMSQQSPTIDKLSKSVDYIFEKDTFGNIVFEYITEFLRMYSEATDEMDLEVQHQFIIDNAREKLDEYYTDFFLNINKTTEDDREERIEKYIEIMTSFDEDFTECVNIFTKKVRIYLPLRQDVSKKYQVSTEQAMKTSFGECIMGLRKKYMHILNWNNILFRAYDVFYGSVYKNVVAHIEKTKEVQVPDIENDAFYKEIHEEAEREKKANEDAEKQKQEEERERLRKIREEEERVQEAERRQKEREELLIKQKREAELLALAKENEENKKRELAELRQKQEQEQKRIEKEQVEAEKERQLRRFEESRRQHQQYLKETNKLLGGDDTRQVELEREAIKKQVTEQVRQEIARPTREVRIQNTISQENSKKVSQKPERIVGNIVEVDKNVSVDPKLAAKKLIPQTDVRKMTVSDLLSVVTPLRVGDCKLSVPDGIDKKIYQYNLYLYFKLFFETTVFGVSKIQSSFKTSGIPFSDYERVMKSIEKDTERLIPGFVREVGNMYKRHMVMFTGSGASENKDIFDRIYIIAQKDFVYLYKSIFTDITIPLLDQEEYVNRIVDLLMIEYSRPVAEVPPPAPFTIESVSDRDLHYKTLLYRKALMRFVYPNIMKKTPYDVKTVGKKIVMGNVSSLKRLYSDPEYSTVTYVGQTPMYENVDTDLTVQPVSVQFCEKIDDQRLVNYDSGLMGLVNRALNSSLTQNLTYLYNVDISHGTESLGLADSKSAIYFYENVDKVLDYGVPSVTFEEWIMTPHQASEIMSVYFQIFHALYILSDFLGLVYYKFSLKDIRIVPVNACGYWKYVVDGVSYFVPNYGSLVLVAGYHNLTTAGDDATKRSYNIKGTFSRYSYDKVCNVVDKSPNKRELKQFKDIEDILSLTLTSRVRKYVQKFSWENILQKFTFFTLGSRRIAQVNLIDTFDSSNFKFKYDQQLNLVVNGDGNTIHGTSSVSPVRIKFEVNNEERLFDIYGFDYSTKYNVGGYDKFGYDKQGYDVEGFNKNGFNSDGYDRSGYNNTGYDKYGYDRSGFNKIGYDRFGYNINGYNLFGFDRTGYNILGYDRAGYNKEGYDIYGYDRTGYDADGYDVTGYDKNGYNKEGVNKYGYSLQGFNADGVNVWGHQKDTYADSGYDSDGYDKDGYDREGYDKEGYDRKGLDINGVPRVRNILGRKRYFKKG